MLRNYAFNLDSRFLKPILEQFEINLNFKVLTPDSFIWKLLINDKIYYLYAEDYVESKEDLLKSISTQLKGGSSVELVPIKNLKEFEYKHLPNESKLDRYAVESGYDFAFLVKSNEDPREAYFNE